MDADLDAGFAAKDRWLTRHGDREHWTTHERKTYEQGIELALDLEAQRNVLVREYNHLALSLSEQAVLSASLTLTLQ